MEFLILCFFYVMTFYAFLPGLISRIFGFRVFKKGETKKEIALTFDDGPDPVYTEKLLDLLARYNAKATFFVVGAHAKPFPELLQRMHREGHTIGVHNFEHKSNWFMRPKTVKRHIDQTNDIIEAATGHRSNYYRPPWGIVNLFDYSNLGHMQIILWSAMFSDWRTRVGAKRLEKRMLKKLRPGEVLLLHDCGRTMGADVDAPANMLLALEAYLEAGQQQQFTFVEIGQLIKLTDQKRVNQLSPLKKTMIASWLAYEKMFHKVFRLKQVGTSQQPVMHYRVITYKGEQVELQEGTNLKKGDDVIELHFDNKLLSGIALRSKTPIAAALRLLREVEGALPQLADQVKVDTTASRAKAVYGVTMIHKGADRLGFMIKPLSQNLFSYISKVYLHVLMRVLTKPKSRREKSSRHHKMKLSPQMLLMSMQKLNSYTSAAIQHVQEEAERINHVVERNLHEAQDASVPADTKTPAI
ncbi:polysaccharide deacetylase family protein [Paenibacillus yanchengensis]|uniref:Polysaccharide deacetylase family protein n=1 Tax=Paenibacillus yanchengensis TaxID=2035833 RepID=A0ABW4YLL1_9BACL